MSEPKKEPTAAEAMLFFSIVKNTKNKADVDWEAVAEEQGFKNAEVAKVRFGQVKRKLGIFSDPAAGPRASPQKTPRKAGSVSKAATPNKLTKTPRSAGKGRAKATVKKEENNDNEDVAKPSVVKEEQEEDHEQAATDQLHNEMVHNDFLGFKMPNPFPDRI
ncbi:Fc.00g014960.m01.CDS01 [Cosmosporella sp. VM-42]